MVLLSILLIHRRVTLLNESTIQHAILQRMAISVRTTCAPRSNERVFNTLQIRQKNVLYK